MGLYTPTISSSGTLNVLLHGTFAFRSPAGAAEITAHMPLLDHHVYRAGNWLGETDFARTPTPTAYHLRGVCPGGVTFNRASTNLIVNLGDLKVPPPFATLIFPLPKKITSLRIAGLSSADFDDPDNLLPQNSAQHLAALQIFSYEIEDEADLRLENPETGGGHYWEPVFSGSYINLHIFSAEDFYDRPSTAATDLNAGLEHLGVRLRRKSAAVSSTSGIRPDLVLPDGIGAEETEDLATRTQRMARLGRLVLQKGEAGQAWFPNEALDRNPPSCGGVIGD